MLQGRSPARSRVELTLLAVVLASASACRSRSARGPAEHVREDALGAFAAHGVRGSFVLRDDTTGDTTIVGREDAARGTPPCSTFKIANTLIGLETGVIPDSRFSLRWDGTKYDIAAWNRDHDVKSAMRDSVVWFYQEVARRIGIERMREWVVRLRYGNARIEGPIDAFWLDDGSLLVTPREQVDFLRRLREHGLAVQRRTADAVVQVLPIDRGHHFVLRAKTGLCTERGRAVGWYVGYAQDGIRTWTFATRLDAPASELQRIMPLRKEITYELLERFAR